MSQSFKTRLLTWSLVVTALAVGALTTAAFGADTPAEVTALIETPEQFDDEAGGDSNADDPAIYVNPDDASKSLVITVLKNGGLDVYDLDGILVQHFDVPEAPGPDDEEGRFNNVDLIYGFGGDEQAVAVVTDRGRDQLRTYAIDPTDETEPLTDITVDDPPFVFSADQAAVNEQATAYGIATARIDNKDYAFVSQRERSVIRQLELVIEDGKVTYTEVGTWNFDDEFDIDGAGTMWTPCQDEDGVDAQFEGMVVDAANGFLYAGQEQVGIWRVPLDGTEAELFETVREYGVPYDRVFDDTEGEFICTLRTEEDPGVADDNLSADVEGLTIYEGAPGYLIASSQGDNTFAVYERSSPNAYVTTFAIVDGDTIDGAQASDGAHVVNVPVGPVFDTGLFVTQDGENTPEVLDDEDEVRENTNFKFVAWGDISEAAGLETDTGPTTTTTTTIDPTATTTTLPTTDTTPVTVSPIADTGVPTGQPTTPSFTG